MLTKILKKDLKRRKGVNIIICLFIFLATVFLASSLNNILSVAGGIDYYLDYANIPGYTLMIDGDSEKKSMESFLDSQDIVKDYKYTQLISISEEDVTIKKDKKSSELDTGGLTVFLGENGWDYCKVFDENNKAFTLDQGEVALNTRIMEKNNLKSGDCLVFDMGGIKKEYTVKCGIKDAAFGSDMSGMTRVIFSHDDFSDIVRIENINIFGVLLIDTDKVTDFQNAFNAEQFTSVSVKIDRGMYQMLYSMEMVMAALLIMVGVCFIMIAFLVLRFTLVYTMEENYSEIGIMQAIGVKNFFIRSIYLVKYSVLVAVGTITGLIASIPVSDVMLGSVSKNIILSNGNTNWWVNGAGALFVGAVVMLFCYGCTRKINKISAIEAIRGGQRGERYHRRRGIKLQTRGRVRVPVYLGLNDILCHIRRYVVLIVTFCLCFVLISIPLNTVNTMKSDEMVGKFALDPESSVYMSAFTGKGNQDIMEAGELNQHVEELKEDLEEEGYPSEVTVPYIFNFTYNKKKSDASGISIMTLQVKGKAEFLSYSEGMAPELENEIAFSRHILETNGWKIGDTVSAVVNGETKDFLITGTYSDYMQLGDSARMNPAIDLTDERTAFSWPVMIYTDTQLSQKELKEELEDLLPQYSWSEAHEILDTSIGEIQTMFDKMLMPMTVFLCSIIALIVIMMEQLFIVREKGEIAMMKSMGFRNTSLRVWQTMRMVWVVVISMIAAIPLSVLSNRFLLKPIFAIMGGEVEIQVDFLQAYVIYPGILLAVIILSAAWASGRVKAIDIRELNNLE